MSKTERDQMEREEYAEQAWEMRANEITPPSFTAWKRQNARMRKAVQALPRRLRNHYGSASEAARGVGYLDQE